MTGPTRDPAAVFGDSFEEHRGRLYQYLRRRLANEDDARELAQEAFLRLLRVSRRDLVSDPQAYLYRIARNLVYEQSSKLPPKGSWADESELETLADTDRTPEAEAERLGLNRMLESILGELPARSRAIVLLFCRQGLSQSEIAVRVGLSKSMVQKCLAQAMAHCRKRLAHLAPVNQGAGR